ncbi:MAG: transcriptional regulator [Spongiibacteraceae bacterium]|jgi:hypothetical protein|nr:transcriptional regulator [Spongiibacteraceae bacterium]
MVKSLQQHRKRISPKVQSEARAKAVAILAEMSLAEVRKVRGKSQTALAESLGIAQSNVSQVESRPDTLISTLSQYIEALGGRLELHAKFPDGEDIEITQFRR